jgi:hypothetical protein
MPVASGPWFVFRSPSEDPLCVRAKLRFPAHNPTSAHQSVEVGLCHRPRITSIPANEIDLTARDLARPLSKLLRIERDDERNVCYRVPRFVPMVN